MSVQVVNLVQAAQAAKVWAKVASPSKAVKALKTARAARSARAASQLLSPVESQPGFWTSRKEEAFRYYYNKARNKADFLFVDAQLDEKRYFQRPNDPRFIRDRMDDSDDESS